MLDLRCALASLALSVSGCFPAPRFESHGPPFDAGTPVDAAVPLEPHARLRVGAWNVRRLGFDASTDVDRVARIIEAHFDLIALSEVMHEQDNTRAGYAALLEALGPGWIGQRTATPRPNQASPFAEHYAVLTRVGRVAACPDQLELRYCEDGDGSAGDARPDRFLREPAFGCYVVTAAGETVFDFVLGVYHARWGTGAVAEIAQEVGALDGAIADPMRVHPRERDLFLIGDFNLESEQLAPLVQATDRTQGSGSTLDAEGNRSDNLLDHLLVVHPEHSRELVGDAEVLDVRWEAGDARGFAARVSDHLPLQAIFDGSGPDDD